MHESDFVIKSALREKISSSQEFQLLLEQLKQNFLNLLVEQGYRKLRESEASHSGVHHG